MQVDDSVKQPNNVVNASFIRYAYSRSCQQVRACKWNSDRLQMAINQLIDKH